LEIDVVTHHREMSRPSSTGHLIQRVVPAARQHLWRRERSLSIDEIRVPGREVWVLHPQGELVPKEFAAASTQVVLLDGSWREASAMARQLQGGARLVSLPMSGASRFWLRAQAEPGRFSTVEALLFLLERAGLDEAARTLRLQFERHVYAHLRSRGHIATAATYLAGSPLREVAAERESRSDDSRAAAPTDPAT
jgi:DTW domain-containing protein YfiP